MMKQLNTISPDVKPLVEAEIEGLPPSVNAIWRTAKGHTYKPKKVRDWQQAAIYVLKRNRSIKRPFDGKASINIRLTVSTKRRMDIDNRIKCLLDCLAPAGVLKDDSQIYSLFIDRCQGDTDKVSVSLSPIVEEQ